MQDRQEPERPESLPRQVKRLAADFGQAVYPTRARWTPWAVYGVCLLAVAGTRVFRGAPSDHGVLPWYVASFVASAAGAPLTLAGLGTALCAGPSWVRWPVGFLSVLLLAAVILPTTELWATAAVVSSVSMRWTTWVAIGLVIRTLGRRSFGTESAPRESLRLTITDLLLLTTAVAVAFGGSVWATQLASRSGDVVLTSATDSIAEAAQFLASLVTDTVPYFPVLLSVFPTGPLRWRRALIGATSSIFLLMLAYFGMSAWSLWLHDGTFDAWAYLHTLPRSVVYYTGEVAGIVGAAICLRWAGYCLWKPVAAQAAR